VIEQGIRTPSLLPGAPRAGPGPSQGAVGDDPGGEHAVYDPAYRRAIRQPAVGRRADAVPGPILDEFVGESPAGRAGDLAWWLPYRVRRRPWPSFAV
jgi:hypothetical protein